MNSLSHKAKEGSPCYYLTRCQLRTWRVENGQTVRQLAVRQQSTTDKSGTPPISADARPEPDPQCLDTEHFVDSEGDGFEDVKTDGDNGGSGGSAH